MKKGRNYQTEYIKGVLLCHLLYQQINAMKQTDQYKHQLKQKCNLMLREIHPEAKRWIQLRSINNAVATQTEIAMNDLITSMAFLSLDELVNANRIIKQYLLDEHNIVIRIRWKYYAKKLGDFISRVWVYVTQPFYWLRSKVEKLILKWN